MSDHLPKVKNHSQSSDLIGKYDSLKENGSFTGEGSLELEQGLKSKDLSLNCRCVLNKPLAMHQSLGLQRLGFPLCQIKAIRAALLCLLE